MVSHGLKYKTIRRRKLFWVTNRKNTELIRYLGTLFLSMTFQKFQTIMNTKIDMIARYFKTSNARLSKFDFFISERQSSHRFTIILFYLKIL